MLDLGTLLVGGEGEDEHTGVTEFNARRETSTLGCEAYLTALLDLIDREARRAKVEPWFAQACLVNGEDPLKIKQRRAAA